MATVTSLFSGGGDNTYSTHTGRFIVHNYYSGNLQPIAYPANVATYSGGQILNSHWSPNGIYLALSTNSGEVYVYYRGGNVLVRVDNGTLGSAAAPNGDSYYKIKWNHDGTSLAVASSASPYIKIWNFSANTFTQITGLPSVPSQAIDLAWNNNSSAYGSSLAFVLASASPLIRVWDRTVGTDTFTNRTATALTNAGSGVCYSVAWSPSDLRLTVGKSANPLIAFIRRTGQNTWVNTNPANPGFNNIRAIAWRPGGGYVAMATDSSAAGSPGIYLYSHDDTTTSGATYTRLANASPLPGSVSRQCYDVAWSPDGTLLAAATTSTPGLQIYNFDAGATPPLSFSSNVANYTDQKTVSWATFNLPDIVVNDVFGNADISSAFSLTSAGGKLFLAGTTITSVFTAVLTADKLKGGSLTAVSTTTLSSTANTTKSAAVNMQAFDTVLYTGGRLQRSSVAITNSLTLSVSADKLRSAIVSLDCISSLSADWNYNPNYVEIGYFDTGYMEAPGVVREGEASLTTVTSLTSTATKILEPIATILLAASLSAIALRIQPVNLTAFSDITLTIDADVIRGGVSALNSQVSFSATVLRIRPADVNLQAFNTVVSATLRIRPAVDIVGVAFTLVATPYNFTKASASLTNTFNVAPNGGKIFGGILQGSSPIPYPTLKWDADYYGEIDSVGYVTQNPLGSGAGGRVFAFWADARDGGGVVVSSPAGVPITIYENSQYFDIRLEDGQLSMTMQSNTRSWYVPTTGWHHYLINMQFPDGEIRAYVDGIQAPTNQTAGSMTALIGNRIRIYDTFNGSIAQFWLGKTVINELTYWYNNGFVDMGVTGITDTQDTGPIEYMPYQTVYYYDRLGLPPDLTGVVKRDVVTGGNIDWNQVEYYGVWGPKDIYVNLPTIVARLIATGDNIVGTDPFTLTAIVTLTANIRYVIKAAAALTSSATVTARLSQVIPSSASLTSQATLLAVTYEFTKATADITAAFTLSADSDEISSGLALSLGSFSLTPAGNVIRDARTSVASNITLIANAADKNMGEAVLFTAFTLEAIPRVTYPIRPEAMTMSAVFTQTSTSKRFRDSQVPLASAWTIDPGVTRAIRRGVVSMSAFDTVLSAGKIIEFLAENTIVVTEEQRRLRVALESTVLLVQMANGVNTITAETTDIVVPQEQGVLLAQFNMPTN